MHVRGFALLGAVLLISAGPAAAAGRIERIELNPTTPMSDGRNPPSMEVRVTVGYGTPPALSTCTVEVTVNEPLGRRVTLEFQPGTERTKVARYIFSSLEGSFTLTARASGGCTGTRTMPVRVVDGSKRSGSADAAGAASGASAGSAKAPSCPSGWQPAAGYPKGAQITCVPRMPAGKMKCPEGTTYFEETAQLGCR